MTTLRETATFTAQLARELPAKSPTEIAKLASVLIRGAASLHKRYEAACSYEWGCTPHYERATEKKEAQILAIAKDAGLVDVRFGRDPRGPSVIVRVPSGDCDFWDRRGLVVPCR